jgi:DNA invertase Pin-like site-specific DNA recombinase
MAEFERDIIKERTQAGLGAARARGRLGGRRKVVEKMNQKDINRDKELYEKKQNTVEEIMQMTGFKSRMTFYIYVVHGSR